MKPIVVSRDEAILEFGERELQLLCAGMTEAREALYRSDFEAEVGGSTDLADELFWTLRGYIWEMEKV